MPDRSPSSTMTGRKEDTMHVLVLSLLVALLVCVLLLAAFALFTITPLARRIERGGHPRQLRPH